MKEKKTDSFNIFDQTNNSFKMLRRTCDSLFRELRQEGVGSSSKSTEPITKDDEQLLWFSGQLDPSTPRGLLNAVFFLNGKNCVLRGGAEHRDLKISQIVRNVSPEGKERYTYTERCLKNRAGGFNQLSVPNKVVHQYSNPAAGNRCHVQILDLYFSKLLKKAFEEDNFYVRPLERVPTDEGTPWFISVPVGKNTLSGMTKQCVQKLEYLETKLITRFVHTL